MHIDKEKLAADLPPEIQQSLVKADNALVSITGSEYNMLMHALFSTQSALFLLMDYISREKRGEALAQNKLDEALRAAGSALDASGKLHSWVLQRVGGAGV